MRHFVEQAAMVVSFSGFLALAALAFGQAFDTVAVRQAPDAVLVPADATGPPHDSQRRPS